MELSLAGIPTGEFIVVAYVPRRVDPEEAYLGFKWIEARETYVTVNQEPTSRIAIGLNGTAPLACPP